MLFTHANPVVSYSPIVVAPLLDLISMSSLLWKLLELLRDYLVFFANNGQINEQLSLTLDSLVNECGES